MQKFALTFTDHIFNVTFHQKLILQQEQQEQQHNQQVLLARLHNQREPLVLLHNQQVLRVLLLSLQALLEQLVLLAQLLNRLAQLGQLLNQQVLLEQLHNLLVLRGQLHNRRVLLELQVLCAIFVCFNNLNFHMRLCVFYEVMLSTYLSAILIIFSSNIQSLLHFLIGTTDSKITEFFFTKIANAKS